MAKKSPHHAKISSHIQAAKGHLDQIEQLMAALKGAGAQSAGDQPPQQGGALPPGVSPLGGQAQ